MRVAFGLLIFGILALMTTGLVRDLLPPDRVTFAAGPQQGGYWRLASEYQVLLARDNIEVDLIETAGSVENAQLLADGTAEVGFLQGGVGVPSPDARSLGALFYEPILVFAKSDMTVPSNPAMWGGLRIAAGKEGSGYRIAAQNLIGAAGLERDEITLVPVGGADVLNALRADTVDIAFLVAPLNAPYLREIFEAPDVRMIPIAHARALSHDIPQARTRELPDGAIRLDPVTPDEPIDVLVLVGQLATTSDLHPALVDRLINAAQLLHGRRDALTDEHQFPSVLGVSLPMNTDALQAIGADPNIVDSVVPYWIAAQIDRVVFWFLPLLVLVPMMRMLPAGYSWVSRRRVWRHYGAIRNIENELRSHPDRNGLDHIEQELAELDARLASMNLPAAFRMGAYDARLHIDLIRKQVEAARRTLNKS